MTAFAFYLLKVGICSGVLFGYYHLFLRNKLFHQWNRFFLLFSVVLSLVLPLVQFNFYDTDAKPAETIEILLIGQSTDHYLEEFVVSNKKQITTETWLSFGYGGISLLILASLVYSLLRILSILRQHRVNVFQNIKFINTSVQGSPFSFLNYIFWNKDISLQTEVGQQIFQHELAHVKEKHTWDKLFMHLIIAIFWCNPFFWFIRKELKFIHEFIADQKAVGDAGTEAFAAMIFQTVYPQQFQSITNQFFQTSIKRRIFMLTQLKNPKVAYASRVIALPIVALLIFSFTVRTKDKTAFEQSFGMGNYMATDTLPKKGKEIAAVDVNSTKKLITITYADGTVETFTEKQAMEKGLINQDFSNRKDSVTVPPVMKSNIRLKTSSANSPLFILDGKEITKEDVDKLDPKRIQSINVLKGASATAVYGEKGKNGVVEIKTKAQASSAPLSLQENGKQVLTGKINDIEVKGNTIGVDAEEVTVVGYKKENATTNDPVFEKAEFAPSVDRDEWRAFLEKHTLPFIEQAASKGMPAGKYTVMVRFIVEKDGSLSNHSIVNDPGYGLGSKVLEMMKQAPKWKPAIQNQHVVRSYHTQPVTFMIEEDEEVTKKSSPRANTTSLNFQSNDALRKAMKLKDSDVILSFSITKFEDGDVSRLDVEGNNYMSAVRDFLKTVKAGETVNIQKILVSRNGVETKLPAVVCKL